MKPLFGRWDLMFDWAYVDGSGEHLGASGGFTTQDAAEQWVCVAREGLLEVGIVEMVLRDRERGSDLYRMGLDAE